MNRISFIIIIGGFLALESCTGDVFDPDSIIGTWLVTSAQIDSCPNSQNMFSFDGAENNCAEETGDFICRKTFITFTDDGRMITRFEDTYPPIPREEYVEEYEIELLYSLTEENIEFCNLDGEGCHPFDYKLDMDILILSDFLGCTGSFTAMKIE